MQLATSFGRYHHNPLSCRHHERHAKLPSDAQMAKQATMLLYARRAELSSLSWRRKRSSRRATQLTTPCLAKVCWQYDLIPYHICSCIRLKVGLCSCLSCTLFHVSTRSHNQSSLLIESSRQSLPLAVIPESTLTRQRCHSARHRSTRPHPHPHQRSYTSDMLRPRQTPLTLLLPSGKDHLAAAHTAQSRCHAWPPYLSPRGCILSPSCKALASTPHSHHRSSP